MTPESKVIGCLRPVEPIIHVYACVSSSPRVVERY